MPGRPFSFANNEYYHVYNRGVEKRSIFKDKYDVERFKLSLLEFNSIEPIGSIYELRFDREFGRRTSKIRKDERLVTINAYCLNPNHYHLMLKQNIEGGISEFMKRLGGGYTKYFNEKLSRDGVLFQGSFKARHIRNDSDLLHLSSYINLNFSVHRYDERLRKLSRSSIEEIEAGEREIAESDVYVKQFKSAKKYLEYAESALDDIRRRKTEEADLKKLLME